METPEKIYIIIDPVWGSMCVNYNKNDVNNIEYIRKDAFIEKTEKWLKEHVLEYTPELNFGVGKTDPDYYTKHFIEDFKKYIKGE